MAQSRHQFPVASHKDGYWCELSDLADKLALHLTMRSGGARVCPKFADEPDDVKVPPHVTLIEINKSNIHELGKLERIKLLFTSLCDFFNFGGTWEEFGPLLAKARSYMRVTLETRPYIFVGIQTLRSTGESFPAFVRMQDSLLIEDQEMIYWDRTLSEFGGFIESTVELAMPEAPSIEACPISERTLFQTFVLDTMDRRAAEACIARASSPVRREALN